MDYHYSTIVDPATYETEGLCDGVSLRLHLSQEPEDLGAIRAQEDWRRLVAPVGFKRGSLGPEYNFLSVAFPETIPDRMEILAYFDEFIFLHDDVVEAVDQAEGDQQNDEAREACRFEKTTRDTGRRAMVSTVAQKMLSMDPGPAAAALALWTEWFDKGAGRQNHNQFDSLDEYLTGVAIFAMGLTIPDTEHELRSQLCRPAWVALGLTNDLYSLDKETEAAKAMGESHVCNAVWVMMREHSLDKKLAKELCRQKIKESVAEYVKIVKETAQRSDISHDLRIFVEAIQYILSGNLIWTRGAPRYHPAATYNSRQLGWMAMGTPKADGVLEAGKTAAK
ncbi:isoprenoid synthase domain-containing protein [Lasiosphaeris hirsuta]|uniref:Isoprenoid synthase domain-containing protein n=1 Tax=Lasiosphaeris hirsuta TaxID=260670 RepID=A0AA39ZVQ3_9PEZI|nr:isoprenoid synthase domain-containing protein [Lasiosphaeris hirsuta]